MATIKNIPSQKGNDSIRDQNRGNFASGKGAQGYSTRGPGKGFNTGSAGLHSRSADDRFDDGGEGVKSGRIPGSQDLRKNQSSKVIPGSANERLQQNSTAPS